MGGDCPSQPSPVLLSFSKKPRAAPQTRLLTAGINVVAAVPPLGEIVPSEAAVPRRAFSAIRRRSGADRRNALFFSLKPNRGERIRTFDFLVPNQAL